MKTKNPNSTSTARLRAQTWICTAPTFPPVACFGRGRGDGASVFVTQGVKAGGGQGLFLAADVLHFAEPGVGVQVGQGEELVARLFDPAFRSQPVEQRALGLLLEGCDLNGTLNEMGAKLCVAAFLIAIRLTPGLTRCR